jgi:hypothetical protein
MPVDSSEAVWITAPVYLGMPGRRLIVDAASIAEPQLAKKVKSCRAHWHPPHAISPRSLNHSSIGARRAEQSELISPPTPTGCQLRGGGLDEAEYDCRSQQHAQKHASTHCPTNAFSGPIARQSGL